MIRNDKESESNDNVKTDGKIVYLPIYMTMFVRSLLQ